MTSFISFRPLLVLFTALFSLTTLLEASEKYEAEYGVHIENCYSDVSLNKTTGYWDTVIILDFSNGLWGAYSKEWKYKYQADQMAELTYSGNVNIFPSQKDQFSLVFEDGSKLESLYLWVDTYNEKIKELINNQPFIQKIEENVQIISKKKKYRYIIELSNGIKWITKEASSPWNNPWMVGSRVILLGNKKHPCLISVSEALIDNQNLTANNTLKDLELFN